MTSWRGGDSSGTPKQSWKKPRGKSQVVSGKYWATGSSSKALVSGKLVRLFLALMALFFSAAAMLFFLLRQDLPTPVIAIATVDYQAPWSPNSWAFEDQQILSTLGKQSRFTVTTSLEGDGRSGNWQQLLETELKKARPGGPGNSLLPQLFGHRSLIVYLSAHGVLNGQGEPCLIFANGDPLDDTTWIRFSEVLETIGQHRVVQESQARVLVALDVGKQPPDVRCGLLTVGFTEAARRYIEALDYPHLGVLVACDDQQHAWSAPEVGSTVFGYMVAAGLQGAADTFSGNRNGRVSVEELHAFVSSAVDGYVREYRGRIQKPQLIWAGGQPGNDFEVSYASEQLLQSGLSIYQSNARAGKLAEVWRLFGGWCDKTSTEMSWHRSTLLAAVTRAEQLAWAGAAYHAQFDQEVGRIERELQSATTQASWPEAICGASLLLLNEVHPQATENLRAGASEESISVADFQNQLVTWLTYRESAAEGEQAPEIPQLPGRRMAVEFLWQWFSANPQHLNLRTLQRANDWLGLNTEPSVITREEALLRTIGDHLHLIEEWPVEVARNLGGLWSRFMTTAWQCEKAIVTRDRRTSATLESLAQPVAARLQLVRDRIHGCQIPQDMAACLRELQSLDSAIAELDDARKRLEQAWRLRDRLACDLPNLAQWIASPLFRIQQTLNGTAAWQLTGELSSQLLVIDRVLRSGSVPARADLDTVENGYSQLAAAYARSVNETSAIVAKGRRKALSDLMLSLTGQPILMKGTELETRGQLHRGIDGRLQDFGNTVTPDKLKEYCSNVQTEGVDADAIWRDADLPTNMRHDYPPLVFAENGLGILAAQSATLADGGQAALAELGAHLRSSWQGSAADLAGRAETALQAMELGEAAEIDNAKQELLTHDTQAHLIAQLVPSRELAVRPAPSVLLHTVVNQHYAFWQATRSLDDFWHTPHLANASEPAYMLSSAAEFINTGSSFERAPNGPLSQLNRKFAATEQLLQAWPDTLRELEITTGPITELSGGLDLSQFPPGRAWIRLFPDRRGGNAIPFMDTASQRLQTEMVTGARPAALRLAVSRLPEGNHELVAWFRGHRATAPVAIYQEAPPMTLAWAVAPPASATIRVNSEPKPARIVFILDCSRSMGNHLQTAKQTLINALRELPGERTEIAVMLYGHAVDYGRGGVDTRSPWKGSERNLEQVRPYNDVELIQPLTRPTPQVISELEGTIAELQPFGRTPMYESILQAARLVAWNDGFSGQRRIIVITDGNDWVYPFNDMAENARAQGGFRVPAEYIHNEAAVQQKIPMNVSIDFIAFNFDAALKRIEDLAKATRGRTYNANSGNLAEQLRNSIAQGTFTTRDLSTGRSLGAGVRLAQEQVIVASQLPGEFEVSIDETTYQKPVALVGGESLELQYRQQVGLHFLKYDEGDTHPGPGEFTLQQTPYAAMMLTGMPRSLPQVRICLQSLDENKQSRRPERLLVEIRRAQSGQEGGPTVAWSPDADWEANHRSPVLRVPILNPPDVADGWLESRLWVATPGTNSQAGWLPVVRLQDQLLPASKGVAASVEYKIEKSGLRVIVEETRDADAALVHWRIQPFPDARIEHRFYPGKVAHEYYYTDPTVLNRLELSWEPLPVAPNDQWQATSWLRVPRW